MLLKLEGTNVPIKTSGLREIGRGQDGRILELGDDVLKICESGYMTEPKVQDLREAVPEEETTRLIVPRKIAYNPQRNPVFRDDPVAGYTQKKITENKTGILKMSTTEYLEEMELLKKQIHELFSKNEIAITDTNPHNILSSENGFEVNLYLIDHDRAITPNSEQHMKRHLLQSDYYTFNEKKVALLLLKVTLLQLQTVECLRNDAISPINSYISEVLESPGLNNKVSVSSTEHLLKPYTTMYEYATDTVKTIKSKRK